MKVNKVINIELRTISPVAIMNDSGNNHNPYVDAVKIGNEIIILDIEKITDAIADNENAIEEYLNILRNRNHNTQEKYRIDNFLKRNSIKIEDVTLKKLKCGMNFDNLTEISTCIKTNGKAYIPGSSLKGSIRTAVLYERMNKKNVINNLDKKEFGKTYVGQDVFQEKKIVNNKTKYNLQTDIFKNLIVRDTEIDKKISTAVYQAKSLNLYAGINDLNLKLDKPMLIECIDKNQVLESQIVIKNNEFNMEDLCSAINDFYEKVIRKEISELEKLFSEEKDILIGKYNELLDLIRAFKKDKNGFVIRCGKLKGLFSNSIDVDFDENSLERIAKCFEKNRGIGQFPTTKWIVTDSGAIKESFGWIEVKIK